MSVLIDSHAHIFMEQFSEDIEDVLQRAADANVGKICMPNINETTIEAMLALSEKYPAICFPMMGLHPSAVTRNFKEQLRVIKHHLDSSERYIAVGEMGIDLYWDTSLREEQIQAFRIQAMWGEEKDLPLVIHSRDSMDLILDILEEMNLKTLHGVFHCFTGTRKQAERIQEMGFYLGLGGILTFKNTALSEVIPAIDLSRVILETDSPYLSPEPKRGRRNEPAHLRYIAEKLAEITGVTIEEIAKKTSENVKNIYKF